MSTDPVGLPSGSSPSASTQLEQQVKDVPLFARLQARQEAENVRDVEAQSVCQVQDSLWYSRVIEPVSGFVPRWRDVWERFEAELRTGNLPAAAAIFAQIDTLLAELQSTWKGASDALLEWYHQHAEPWNERHRGMGTFQPLWYREGPASWLARWERPLPEGRSDAPSPREIPARIAGWIINQLSESFYNSDRYRLPLRAIALFDILGRGKGVSQGAPEFLFAGLGPSEREQLAAISLVLAVVILPVPEFLPAFFDGLPNEEAMNLADAILVWSSVATGDWLWNEFRRIRAERCPVAVPQLAPDAIPEQAEGEAGEQSHDTATATETPAQSLTPPTQETTPKGEATNPPAVLLPDTDTRKGRRKFTQADKQRIEAVVRDYLTKHTAAPTKAERQSLISAIRIDDVAKVAGCSAGYLSESCAAWRVFENERKEQSEPSRVHAKERHLTHRMLASRCDPAAVNPSEAVARAELISSMSDEVRTRYDNMTPSEQEDFLTLLQEQLEDQAADARMPPRCEPHP
jgi:hypothetical protein